MAKRIIGVASGEAIAQTHVDDIGSVHYGPFDPGNDIGIEAKPEPIEDFHGKEISIWRNTLAIDDQGNTAKGRTTW